MYDPPTEILADAVRGIDRSPECDYRSFTIGPLRMHDVSMRQEQPRYCLRALPSAVALVASCIGSS
jgi:hypothetical protein